MGPVGSSSSAAVAERERERQRRAPGGEGGGSRRLKRGADRKTTTHTYIDSDLKCSIAHVHAFEPDISTNDVKAHQSC